MHTLPFSPWSKTTGVIAVTALSLYITLKKIKSINQLEKLEKERKQRLIVITGCDSGMGYSMAVWAAKLGYKVIAGCLLEHGEGAQKLRRQFPDLVIVTSLNVTDSSSLENFYGVCKQTLDTHNGKLYLWALIANAAVCTMGEFFWQTPRQKEHQMDVNFWGAVNFISEFRMLLLETKARVIIISSDCATYPLPFLSTYSASKAALNTWTQSFRFEVAKYGVNVVAFHPRDFATSSGLFANIEQQHEQMAAEMNGNEREFYGDYFDNFMKAKQEAFGHIKKKPIKPLNSVHKKTFIYLLESDIKKISVYRDFDILAKIFHMLFLYLPQHYVDKMVNILLNPSYKTIYWKEKKQNVSTI